MSNKISDLSNKLSGFLKISKKQSEKITSEILTLDQQDFKLLLETITNIKNQYSFCQYCHGLKFNNKCEICFDNHRDNILLVLEDFNNILKFENLNFYYGKYYVLPFLLNTKNLIILEDKNNPFIQFVNYAKQFDEVIFALSPTLNGVMTTIKLEELLSKENIKHSRLAIGVPMGSNIEYLDGLTLEQAIKNRK